MSIIKIKDLTVLIEKKNIKNLYLYIKPPMGDIKISVPRNMPDEKIRAFIESKIPWIQKQQRKIQDNPPETEYQYSSGESHFLWGQRYILDVIYPSAKNEALLKDGKIVLHICKENNPSYRGKMLYKWYRHELKTAVSVVSSECEETTKITAKEFKIKDMKTKWGTCNISKKRIWLNLQLVRKKPECLRYIIIHELVHLLEKYHNNKFRLYMDKFCPDWRSIKKSLDRQ
jgi:Predicted metal-dependent hydrolase